MNQNNIFCLLGFTLLIASILINFLSKYKNKNINN